MSHGAGTKRQGLRWPHATLIGVVVIGLAADAYVHLALANDYDLVKSPTLTQGDLFRAESSLAILAGLLLLIWPRVWSTVIAFLVSAGGFVLVLVYQFVDVGKIGFLPDMYDPTMSGQKALSIVGEGIAAIAAVLLFVALSRLRDERERGRRRAYAQTASGS